MYLTDYRERSLKDVITQLEPGLFKKVTGLNVKDFELLCSLGVFNASLMNDAIFKFKRYEDSSLSYTGIEKHVSDEIGGWDTVIKREEYERLFYNQQSTMQSDAAATVDDESTEEPETTKYIEKPEQPDFLAATQTVRPIVTTTVQKQEQPDKPKMDLSAVNIGTKVLHKKFGEGAITNIDKARKYIRIAFSVGEKTFVMPSCFEEGFLKIY